MYCVINYISYSKHKLGVNLLPGTLPMEAIYSTNASTAGNGDFPIKYVLEGSLSKLFNSNACGVKDICWKLWAICVRNKTLG